MQECDDTLGDIDLEVTVDVSKANKTKAMQDRQKRVKLMAEKTRRSRTALEKYVEAKIPGAITVVPFRDDNGAICYALKQAKLSTEELYACLTPFWKTSRAKKPGAGSRGFNTRNEK